MASTLSAGAPTITAVAGGLRANRAVPHELVGNLGRLVCDEAGGDMHRTDRHVESTHGGSGDDATAHALPPERVGLHLVRRRRLMEHGLPEDRAEAPYCQPGDR